jgi:hypothetical protein
MTLQTKKMNLLTMVMMRSTWVRAIDCPEVFALTMAMFRVMMRYPMKMQIVLLPPETGEGKGDEVNGVLPDSATVRFRKLQRLESRFSRLVLLLVKTYEGPRLNRMMKKV